MLENQKLFIQRHIRELVGQHLPPAEILQKSLLIINNQQTTSQALRTFDKSGSLTQTLQQLDIIQLEPALLNTIKQQEQSGSQANTSFVALLEANETISSTFDLLKARLSNGLTYALTLSMMATVVFSIITIYVFPQFNELFYTLGAELPDPTRMALAWNESWLSPGVIAFLFTLLIALLTFSIRLLSDQKINNSWLRRIPLINQVILFTENIHWLSQLRVLNSTGLSLDLSLDKGHAPSIHLKKQLPDLLNELKVAEKIGTLDAEFEFQSRQLNHLAEKIVTRVSRNLVTMVMSLVVGFIFFALYATYLPIFQIGAAI